MAINLNSLGAETPWFETYITQNQIDGLCNVLGDFNPLFLDEEIAKSSGANCVVAPPTFINCFRTYKTALVLSEADVDLPLLLHGEQRIRFYGDITPGMKVRHKIKIIDIGAKKSHTYGELDFFTVLIKIQNAANKNKLVEATQLFFVRKSIN